MEKEIIVGTRTFKVREIIAVELDDVDFNNKKEMQKALVTKGASLSDEDYSKLTLRERLHLLKEINDINGFGDFQQTSGANKDLLTS